VLEQRICLWVCRKSQEPNFFIKNLTKFQVCDIIHLTLWRQGRRTRQSGEFAEFSNDWWMRVSNPSVMKVISSQSSRDFLLGDSSLYVAKCGLVAVSTPHTECTLQGGDTVNKEKPKVASEKPHKSTARHDASGNEGQVTTPLYGLKFLFPRKLNIGSYQVFPTKKDLTNF
jgi:uncharacterized protein with NAD-binding domain and iron-sulfur cluster